MLKGPACGPSVTCSFHKCLHRLLFLIVGNKQSTQKCLDLVFQSYACRRGTFHTHKNMSLWCAIITMAIRHHRHRPASTRPRDRLRSTCLIWFCSFVCAFIDFHYSACCQQTLQNVSSHLLPDRYRPRQMHIYQSVIIKVVVKKFFFFILFMDDLLVGNQFVQ